MRTFESSQRLARTLAMAVFGVEHAGVRLFDDSSPSKAQLAERSFSGDWTMPEGTEG